jgi:outer membrane protein
MTARRLVLCLLPLVGLPLAVSGEPVAPREQLSFREALQRALRVNASVERARADLGAAEAVKKGALSLVLPRLGATGGLVRNSEEVTFGSSGESRTILPLNDWSLRLILQQPVFAGLREKRTYDQSKQGVLSALEGLRGTQERILLRVAGEYITLAAAEALARVEQRNLELARQRRTQAQAFVEAGESTKVDLLRAETAIRAAERRLLAARQTREAALGRLRVDLALDGEIEVEAPEALPTPPLPDEQALLARAELERADLKQAAIALRVAGLEVQKQWGAWLPVVTADAGLVRQKTSFPTNSYGFAALRFSVPLFQGGETSAKVALARERERQARASLEEARRSVREDVRRALVDAQAAAATLELAREQLVAAEAEYQQVFELYQGQEATSLDVSASEAGLAEARRALVVSRAEQALYELNVWSAAGALKPALNLEEVTP